MVGPQDKPIYSRNVGGAMMNLEPTPYLKYVNGLLHVWYEATNSGNGTTVGEYLPAFSVSSGG